MIRREPESKNSIGTRSITEVSTYLGHADSQITLKVYSLDTANQDGLDFPPSRIDSQRKRPAEDEKPLETMNVTAQM